MTNFEERLALLSGSARRQEGRTAGRRPAGKTGVQKQKPQKADLEKNAVSASWIRSKLAQGIRKIPDGDARAEALNAMNSLIRKNSRRKLNRL